MGNGFKETAHLNIDQKKFDESHKRIFWAEKNTKINLCNTCTGNFEDCSAGHFDIEYGDGVGNDNVIRCDQYREIK